MHTDLKKRLIFIILITLVAAYISLPNKFMLLGVSLQRRDINFSIGNFHIRKALDLKLGLDLVGGSHLVFEADTSSFTEENKTSALESLKSVIEKRVNLFGISEPNIQLSNFEGKERVIVELPGINNTSEAISLVGQTAQLVFAEVSDESLIPTDLTGADLKNSSVSFDNVTGKPVVLLEFTDEGGKKFAELTEKNIGKNLPMQELFRFQSSFFQKEQSAQVSVKSLLKKVLKQASTVLLRFLFLWLPSTAVWE